MWKSHKKRAQFSVRAPARCSNTPTSLPTFSKTFRLHASYLGFSWGWLVSYAFPDFLLSSLGFVYFEEKRKSCLGSGATACPEWLPWEWMVQKHRLRSQREPQTLMGLPRERRRRAVRSDVSSRGWPWGQSWHRKHTPSPVRALIQPDSYKQQKTRLCYTLTAYLEFAPLHLLSTPKATRSSLPPSIGEKLKPYWPYWKCSSMHHLKTAAEMKEKVIND